MREHIDKKHRDQPPEVSKSTSHGRRGRPQGSNNRHRRDGVWSPALRFVQEAMARLRRLIGDHLQVWYVVDDGAFGHHDARHMVTPLGWPLISKLRHDAARYFPSAGPYSGRGKRKKSGQKLDDRKMSDDYLNISSLDKDIQTPIDQ